MARCGSNCVLGVRREFSPANFLLHLFFRPVLAAGVDLAFVVLAVTLLQIGYFDGHMGYLAFRSFLGELLPKWLTSGDLGIGRLVVSSSILWIWAVVIAGLPVLVFVSSISINCIARKTGRRRAEAGCALSVCCSLSDKRFRMSSLAENDCSCLMSGEAEEFVANCSVESSRSQWRHFAARRALILALCGCAAYFGILMPTVVLGVVSGLLVSGFRLGLLPGWRGLVLEPGHLYEWRNRAFALRSDDVKKSQVLFCQIAVVDVIIESDRRFVLIRIARCGMPRLLVRPCFVYVPGTFSIYVLSSADWDALLSIQCTDCSRAACEQVSQQTGVG